MPCTLKLLGFKQIIIVNEHKIRSLYQSTVFLWLARAFLHIIRIFLYNPGHIEFSFAAFFFVFHQFQDFVPRSSHSLSWPPFWINFHSPWTNQLLDFCCACARVFSPAAVILENEKTLGTKLGCSSFSMFVTQWDTGYPIMLWYVQTINFGIRILSLMPMRFENLAKPNSKSDL